MNAREVEPLVKVAGVARAFAEIGDDDVVGVLDLERVPEASGHRQVRAQHARVAEDAQLGDAAMERGIASFRETGGFAEHLRHHDARLDALHQERTEISMERTDVVLLAEAEARADDNRFLADARVDAAAHFSLPDENAEPFVEGANQLQPIEHLEQLFRRQLEFRSLDRRHVGGYGPASFGRSDFGTERRPGRMVSQCRAS